jgi:hypothetical protein
MRGQQHSRVYRTLAFALLLLTIAVLNLPGTHALAATPAPGVAITPVPVTTLGLRFTPALVTGGVVAGGQVTYYLNLHNYGPASVPFKLTVNNPDGWKVQIKASDVAIKAGGDVAVALTIGAPTSNDSSKTTITVAAISPTSTAKTQVNLQILRPSTGP